MENTIVSADTHSDDEQINTILINLGYDTTEESMRKTPMRYCNYIHTFTKNTDDDFIAYCKKYNIKNTSMKDKCLPIKITVDNISIHSACKHHMLPFYGTVSISYITNGYTLGLSKFKRIVDFTANELTSQEELTQQIVRNITSILPVRELHIKVECVHSCMIIRGVKDLHTTTTTELHIEETELGIFNKL